MIKSITLKNSGRTKSRFVTYNEEKKFYTIGFEIFQPKVDYDDDSFMFHTFRMAAICKVELCGIRQMCTHWFHTQSDSL